MRQVIIRKGKSLVVELPAPAALEGYVLVELRASCVSPGTEMAGIAASGKSLLQRAIEQPDKARLALRQMREQGIGAVWQRARQKFDRDALCGYSAAGVVLDVGHGVEGFPRGMRVAVAGAGLANHADVVAVPVNLTVPIPDGVGFEEASSIALGAIAMQGVRRAEVSLGERVAVIGCGPLGLLAVQMLRASGCRVFATDLDERRLALAREFGAERTGNPSAGDIVKGAVHWASGLGVDAAIVFTATASSEPLSQAFQMCRRKGRVVLVGVAGGEYKRDDMYQKELDFVISTSYGPGRYDEDYELRGKDYPYAYVRWTEKRNMEAYLDLIRRGLVRVEPLIEVREPLANAAKAYEQLKSPEKPVLAVLQYGEAPDPQAATAGTPDPTGVWVAPGADSVLALAIVGGGSFVQAMHVPSIKALEGRITVPWSCSRTGTSARACAAALPGCQPVTRYEEVLADPKVHAVLIGTRHDTHANLTVQALKAGKAVFVEKPMCLTPAEFDEVKAAVQDSAAPYMVGYNRRFSPFADIIRRETAARVHPLMVHYTMNAGYLPPAHWTQGPEGGGRLLGEACHIIDLFRSLIGHPVKDVVCSPLRSSNPAALPTDNFTLTLTYEDGSVATLLYTALGHKEVPKERMEVFCDEKAFILDDYLTLRAHGVAKGSLALKQRDKGHAAELAAFHRAATTGVRFPIPWEELEETWQVSWQADQICRHGGEA
jgi:predicted dehydrogenase/threonine dehydrogenase-like Zn-dependent dehydrogenase